MPHAPDLSCELIEDARGAEWDQFVRSRPDAAAYHRYAWRGVMRSVFRRETYYLMARDRSLAGDYVAGPVVGILPLARLKSPFFGDFLVSLPYFTYGGVLSASEPARAALLAAACALADRLGVSHAELRHRDNLYPAMAVRTDKVSMVLALPRDAALLWKALPSKVRAQIKRPQREGVTLASGAEELLPDFYTVFATNMRDLGTPVYAPEFFRCILRTFPDSTCLFVARHRGQPVAAGLVVGSGDMLEIPWASSLRRVNNLGVNMFLYWSVLEYACTRNYAGFDFGRSTPDSSTYRFKKQWGAEPLQLYWHYWLRAGGEPPRLNPTNRKYRAAIAVWQRLPLFVANRLGPILARNLP